MVKCSMCQMDLREIEDFKEEIQQSDPSPPTYEQMHAKYAKRAEREFTPRGLQMHKLRKHGFCFDAEHESEDWRFTDSRGRSVFNRGS